MCSDCLSIVRVRARRAAVAAHSPHPPLPGGLMPTSRPILIVEDDAALRATLAEQICLEGDFTADEAESASEAEQKLASADAHYDAILLDIGLPDGDGRDLCAKLRRDGMKMPVIMLTGADG